MIEAIGRAQIETTANRARFSVTFQETARDAQAAQGDAADRARLAVAAMRRVAPEGVEISSAITVAPIQTDIAIATAWCSSAKARKTSAATLHR